MGKKLVRRELLALGYQITVPQSKPLSPGEVLGCTAPQITSDHTAIMYSPYILILLLGS